jgi:inner membrane protein
MPSIFSHAIVAVTLGEFYPARRVPVRFWVLSAICAALPDIDVIGFAFGIPYGALLGHRGLTHSLCFAAVLSLLVVWLRFNARWFSKQWCLLVVYFFIVTASHGVLDAMTNGGLGVAFFSPFSNTRYFFSWRPIQVSPIGLDFLFSGPSWLISEIKWIWIPAAVLVASASFYRKLRDEKSDRAL